MWFGGNFKPEGKHALIVGASQGVGAELGYNLFKRNCSVTLVARSQDKLKSHVEKIKGLKDSNSELTGEVEYRVCDASSYESCAELWNNLLEDKKDPDFIFCCTGGSTPKLFADLTKEDLQLGITTNYTVSLNVIHSGFKQILESNRGVPRAEFKKRHVILFSSVVSFYPFIGYAQYAPLKSAVQSLSLILRQELGPFNYRVSCVFPGSFQSEGYDEEEKTKPKITKEIEGPSKPIPVEICADMVVSQLDKGYDTITTDFIGWLLGCSVLGTLPRSWGILQVFVSLIFLIIGPIANLVVYKSVLDFFKKRDAEEDDGNGRATNKKSD